MDEGGAEREGQPIISDLFPVSEKSILTAFKNLSLTEYPNGAEIAANEENNIFRETNTYAAAYFAQTLLGSSSREHADQIFWGILVSHQALREEASSRGGILPTFTRLFVQIYHNKEVESILDKVADTHLGISEAVNQLRRQQLVEFENKEPEVSRVVREKLSVQPDWRPEQDPRYLGIVNLYLLFRKGFRDPKNFQQ